MNLIQEREKFEKRVAELAAAYKKNWGDTTSQLELNDEDKIVISVKYDIVIKAMSCDGRYFHCIVEDDDTNTFKLDVGKQSNSLIEKFFTALENTIKTDSFKSH